MSTSEAKLAKNRLDEIKVLLKSGQITYFEAKELAIIPLTKLNKGMKKVSTKYGFKHREVFFAQFMR